MPKEQQNSQASDHDQRVKANRTRSRLYTLTRFLFLGFFLVFLGTGIATGLRIYQDWRDAQAFAGLNELVTEPTDGSAPTENGMPELPSETVDFPIDETKPESNDPQILAKYRKVYEMNQDMYGWISIDGMEFSYPVMYTPEDEDYYLRRGFDGGYARSGVPFISANCKPGSNHYIIYGHNMTNGTMFAQLFAYSEESYWKEHPVIQFDTLYEAGEYEIISVFYSRVFYQYETKVFRYYDYEDLSDPDDFSKYVGEVLDLSLYDTGLDARYGDELITLITCSYENRIPNERFVIVARKVP